MRGCSEETTLWFRRHAGLLPGDATGSESVSRATGAVPADPAAVRAAFDDFLRALETLNTELNGERPSESFDSADSIPTAAAYSVGEIIRQLREADAANEAWEAETAWLAVLAGDIDDLRQHLREEQSARPA